MNLRSLLDAPMGCAACCYYMADPRNLVSYATKNGPDWVSMPVDRAVLMTGLLSGEILSIQINHGNAGFIAVTQVKGTAVCEYHVEWALHDAF